MTELHVSIVRKDAFGINVDTIADAEYATLVEVRGQIDAQIAALDAEAATIA